MTICSTCTNSYTPRDYNSFQASPLMEYYEERDLLHRLHPVDSNSTREHTLSSSISDITDDSDLAAMKLTAIQRTLSIHTSSPPLPRGRQDVGWVAPLVSGLEHSSAIFESLATDDGGLVRKMNDTQAHYREWQEDNGVAQALGTKPVTKGVNGKAMSVRMTQKMLIRQTQSTSYLDGGSTSAVAP